MNSSVAVIDTGLGNIRSVANAVESLGCRVSIASRPNDTNGTSHVILPGVGTFKQGVQNLRTGGWIDHLQDEVLVRGKCFLGICLGMQLLGSLGLEEGRHEGLNWIEGTVDRIRTNDPGLRVPHVGWNTVTVSRCDPLWEGMGEAPTFYFVHSYHLKPDKPDDVLATCQHGEPLVVAVRRGNVAGVQFHPEKSQDDGLRLLRNFVSQPV